MVDRKRFTKMLVIDTAESITLASYAVLSVAGMGLSGWAMALFFFVAAFVLQPTYGAETYLRDSTLTQIKITLVVLALLGSLLAFGFTYELSKVSSA